MTPLNQALKDAQCFVGVIHYTAGQYTFNVLDREAGAWREGPPYADKRTAGLHRRRAMVREALTLLGVDAARADYLIQMSPACDDIPRGGELAILAALYQEDSA